MPRRIGDGILSGRVPREQVPYQRKRDDYKNYFDVVLGVRNWQFQFPRGAINSQKIDLFIRELTRDAEVAAFDRLPIPFEAVATDLTTGEAVVFRQGKLATALRASMAVPGLFDPVAQGETLLVDGGLARQLPIENLKQKRCADVLLVVDVGSDNLAPQQIKTVFDVLAQTTNVGIMQNVRQQLALLTPADMVLRPELGGVECSRLPQKRRICSKRRTSNSTTGGGLATLCGVARSVSSVETTPRTMATLTRRVSIKWKSNH